MYNPQIQSELSQVGQQGLTGPPSAGSGGAGYGGLGNFGHGHGNQAGESLGQKYDLETQYKIYICGQKREPPMFGLASPLAREGGRIVPLLKAKLESADDDSTVQAIVYVFAEMNVRGTYDLAADKSLMEELRLKVSRVKDPAWQNMIEKNLPEIREKSPKTSKP